MMAQRIALVGVIVLALAGWVINMHLTAMHTTQAERPGWFAGACTPEDDASYNCKEVLKTRWAVVSPVTWSFVDPDPETGQQTGIPVALLGWFYFTAVFLWYLLIGRVDYARRWWHRALLATVCVGCAVSVFFIYILYARMDIKCFWCLLSHGINFAILVATVFLHPRRPQSTPAEAGSDASPGDAVAVAPPMPAHPGDRLLLATILSIAVAVYAVQNLVQREVYKARATQHSRVAARYKQEIDRIQEDADTQFAWFKGQKPRKFKLRDDDPYRGPALSEPALTLIVFSDFECPHCARFASNVEKKIDPVLKPYLRVYWKHMPWCKSCNPYSRYDMHPQACKAGFAAEAARMQGGIEAFWQAHDYLFKNRAGLAQLDYRKFAEDLGLDADRIVEDMTSEAVRKRVLEDIEMAKSTGVRGTPAVYLEGRAVPTYMLGNQFFLKAVRRDFEHQQSPEGQKAAIAEMETEEDSDTNAPSATPDNPDPQDAP